MKKVTLYIATHNKTGLKYFGKTTLYFTVQNLQKYYHGSGKYWQDHLKKHGDDVTMSIYGIYTFDEVEKIAIKFSKDNNIVKALNESNKKIWANERPENGLDGGDTGTSHLTRKQSLETMKNTLCENGLSIFENRRLKHIETLASDEYKETKITRKNREVATRKKLDENGVSAFEKSVKKGVLTRKTTILENGLTIEENRELKRQETNKKNGRWFILYKNNEVINEKISLQELNKISRGLKSTTKETYFGHSKRSLATIKRYNNEHLLGMYVEETT